MPSNARMPSDRSQTKQESSPEDVAERIKSMELNESPMNINLKQLTPIVLPKLTFTGMSVIPMYMKLVNTGSSLVLTGQWGNIKPEISDGPLLNKYEFSQMHFHWGANSNEGSEHTFNGVSFPLEMHVVFSNKAYPSHKEARLQPDGMVVIVYVFLLQEESNESFQPIFDELGKITNPVAATRFEPIPLSSFVQEFRDDYFLYRGKVTGKEHYHVVTWIVCRDPMFISWSQIASFHELLDTDGCNMIRNYRESEYNQQQSFFHVNPPSVPLEVIKVQDAMSQKANKVVPTYLFDCSVQKDPPVNVPSMDSGEGSQSQDNPEEEVSLIVLNDSDYELNRSTRNLKLKSKRIMSNLKRHLVFDLWKEEPQDIFLRVSLKPVTLKISLEVKPQPTSESVDISDMDKSTSRRMDETVSSLFPTAVHFSSESPIFFPKSVLKKPTESSIAMKTVKRVQFNSSHVEYAPVHMVARKQLIKISDCQLRKSRSKKKIRQEKNFKPNWT